MANQNLSPKIPIYIALGTNLGDRLANLQSAIRQMPPEVTILAQSPIYQTPPWGYADQPDFLNQVVMAETNLPPQALLDYLKALEVRVGRTPTFRYGPRVVDLDILFYGDLIYAQAGLQIPHPKLHERAFVVIPLYDLNPDFRHPLTGQTIREMRSSLDLTGITRFGT
ncbi:MAG TPA: 2-amino-4-hydroxy-6-hydroxymethyldihydropteridine diphosphokinase [Chloroflexi bacterium]|nr:2-amino-4-hydroxy-6-hydroxymethyldihydropteridine diphosphokinase [Chloroflexota bacterium]